MNKSEEKKEIKIAVRKLAAASRQEGGLSSNFSGGVSGAEGIALHQQYAQMAPNFYPEAKIYSEYQLQATYISPTLPYKLTVEGRSDIITIEKKASTYDITLVEVKSFHGSSLYLPKDGENSHWIQAKIYAYMLFESALITSEIRGNLVDNKIKVELHYVSIDDGELINHKKEFTFQQLEEFFFKTCEYYLRSRAALINYKIKRNQVNTAAGFPFSSLRQGQHEIMREVTAAIRDKEILFLSAATGSGKTIASLYPALKSQAHGLTETIYYLTPSRSQRSVAEEALQILRNNDFLVKSITIRAKESMCAAREFFCDKSKCPYATSYYERLDKGKEELIIEQELLPDAIFALGKKYRLCPFELSLDLMLDCDVIICDYNYVFDPRIRWQEMLDDPNYKYTLLVDEAHNLAERSRSMFSAIIQSDQIEALIDILLYAFVKNKDNTVNAEKETKTIKQKKTDKLSASNNSSQHKAINKNINIDDLDCDYSVKESLKALFELRAILLYYQKILRPEVEKKAKDKFVKQHQELILYYSPQFFATRHIPSYLTAAVSRVNLRLFDLFYRFREFTGREEALRLRFELLYFQRIVEEFYDESYITAVRCLNNATLALSLLCLDASEHLTEIYYNKSPVIFFSATLEPFSYFVTLLDSRAALEQPEILKLASPFPRERRLVIAYDEYSVRYRDRILTLPSLTDLIISVIKQHKGNYLLFCPSFSYLNKLRYHLKNIELPQELKIIVQPRRMNDKQKNAFLQRFLDSKSDQSLLGITVLGSLFTEGIDLKGEALTGVIVIGTGLPALTPEREILRQYYDAKSRLGYQYAYTWPGFNRVTQAAGRLIRTANDYGVVLLIDDRYSREDYRQLFPDDWNLFFAHDQESCLNKLQAFWREIDSTSM